MTAVLTEALTSAEANDRFLEMLPAIEQALDYELRWLRSETKEELTAEAIAGAYCAFVRLVQRGKMELAYPTILAKYALKHVRAGRLVGGRSTSSDVLSRYTQRKRGLQVVSLTVRIQPGRWQELLIEDRRSTPADLAAMRIDFSNWLNTLSRRKRALALSLAQGESTLDVARRFRLTSGRISQYRRELKQRWEAYHQNPPDEAAA